MDHQSNNRKNRMRVFGYTEFRLWVFGSSGLGTIPPSLYSIHGSANHKLAYRGSWILCQLLRVCSIHCCCYCRWWWWEKRRNFSFHFANFKENKIIIPLTVTFVPNHFVFHWTRKDLSFSLFFTLFRCGLAMRKTDDDHWLTIIIKLVNQFNCLSSTRTHTHTHSPIVKWVEMEQIKIATGHTHTHKDTNKTQTRQTNTG